MVVSTQGSPRISTKDSISITRVREPATLVGGLPLLFVTNNFTLVSLRL